MMTFFKIMIISVLPGFLWIRYIYRQDRYEPEPKSEILKAFIVGVFCAFPAIYLENLFAAHRSFSMIVFIAPVVEECVKFLFFILFFYFNREFDEPLDGIIYASSLALGFATIENVFYIFNAAETGNPWQTAISRSLLSIPGHFLFSAMWGYAVGIVKFRLHQRMTLFAGLTAGILCHALFNIAAILSAYGAGLFIIIASLFFWQLFKRRIQELQNDSRNRRNHRKLI